MLIMQACLLCPSSTSSMCLLPYKVYADNENCYKLTAYMGVCDRDDYQVPVEDTDDNKDVVGDGPRAHYLLTFSLRISRYLNASE